MKQITPRASGIGLLVGLALASRQSALAIALHWAVEPTV
jgi:hypothetical protein